MQHIAFYDLDKTITRRATFLPFLAYAVPRTRPWRIVLAPVMILTVLAWAAGRIDRGRLKQINLALMMGSGIDEATLNRLAARFAGRTLAKNVYGHALDRIDADRADKYRIVIASASYDFYVSQIARLLGADTIATRFDGENCYGEEKLARVKSWLADQHIDRAGAHIRFYSDHASDAPCLAWADEAFAANPHAALRTLAEERGWTILDWD